jgi:hypothetical protein
MFPKPRLEMAVPLDTFYLDPEHPLPTTLAVIHMIFTVLQFLIIMVPTNVVSGN